MSISAQATTATIRMNLQRRPLLQSDTVQECLDVSREKLMAMIEAGEIAWAWHVGFGAQRKELRVLAHCLVERQTGPIAGIGATKDLKLPEIVNLILPKVRQTIRGTELQRLFGINPNVVKALSDSGNFDRVPEKLQRSGPNSSPHYTRASVVEFLKNRRLL